MKKFLRIFVIVFLVCCNTYAQYQVNYRSSTTTSITVRCVGYASNAKKALADAELSAIKAVLFQGIDNHIALISITEVEATKQYGDYFNNLFTEGYKQFISSSEVIQPFSKDINKRKNIVVDITIKQRALREDLERNGIIRKFGF